MAVSRRRRSYAPRLPPAERREQLLDCALAIIAERGYGAVSMESIAREAGVTRPVVYGAFANLGILLGALILRERKRAIRQLSRIVPTDPGERDPDDVLVDAVSHFLNTVAAHPQTWRLILLPVDGTPSVLRREVEKTRAGVLKQIRGLVAWGLARRGAPAELDVDLLARAILVLAEESGRLILTLPDEYPPERMAGFTRALLAAVPRLG